MENSNPKISVITPTIRPDGLMMVQQCLQQQGFQDFEWLTEIGFPEKSDLNAALNRMVRRARGELLVFYQDFIFVEKDCLQNFWNAYQENKKGFFTGCLNGDWRKDAVGKKLQFTDWEIDLGACSKEAMFKIGGFDETLDEFWGFDNVNAGLRADMAGYEIYAIANKGGSAGHPPAPMKKNRNPQYHNRRLDEIRQGLKINYL